MAYMDDDGCWCASRSEEYRVHGYVTVAIELGVPLGAVTVTEDDLARAVEGGWDSDETVCRMFREECPDIAGKDGEVVGIDGLWFIDEEDGRYVYGRFIIETYVSCRCSDIDDSDEGLTEALDDALYYDYDIICSDGVDFDIEEA